MYSFKKSLNQLTRLGQIDGIFYNGPILIDLDGVEKMIPTVIYGVKNAYKSDRFPYHIKCYFKEEFSLGIWREIPSKETLKNEIEKTLSEMKASPNFKHLFEV